MSKLKNIEDVVEKILDIRDDARENDDILYLYVCEYFHRGSSSMTLKDFLKTRNKTTCPNFTSVTRIRRKVFKKRPELKPKEMTRIREDAIDDYINYALGN